MVGGNIESAVLPKGSWARGPGCADEISVEHPKVFSELTPQPETHAHHTNRLLIDCRLSTV